jgi:hypothetical protein
VNATPRIVQHGQPKRLLDQGFQFSARMDHEGHEGGEGKRKKRFFFSSPSRLRDLRDRISLENGNALIA